MAGELGRAENINKYDVKDWIVYLMLDCSLSEGFHKKKNKDFRKKQFQ